MRPSETTWSRRSSFLLALVLAAAPAARAAHPLITEDTGTQGAGNWQLELNVDRLDLGPSWSTQWGTTLAYGLREDLDVQAGIPYTAGAGKGDLALDLKWRFWQREELSLGLKPGLTLPSGDERRGLGAGRTTYGALLFGSYEPDDISLHAQAGYRRNENTLGERRDLVQASASFWLKPSEALKLVSDASWSTDPAPGGRAWARAYIAGVIYSPRKDIDLDAGMRWDRSGAGTRTRGYLAGVTLRW